MAAFVSSFPSGVGPYSVRRRWSQSSCESAQDSGRRSTLDADLMTHEIPHVDVGLHLIRTESHSRPLEGLDSLHAEGEECSEQLKLVDGQPQSVVPRLYRGHCITLDLGQVQQDVAHRGVHQTNVANDPIAVSTRIEGAGRHHIDDHLSRFDIPALGVAAESGGATERLHSLGEGVVGRKAGHEQPHAQLGAEFAEDPLPVTHQIRVRPVGPTLFQLRKRTDPRQILVNGRPAQKPRTSHGRASSARPRGP